MEWGGVTQEGRTRGASPTGRTPSQTDHQSQKRGEQLVTRNPTGNAIEQS
jgi:hypothetical protein